MAEAIKRPEISRKMVANLIKSNRRLLRKAKAANNTEGQMIFTVRINMLRTLVAWSNIKANIQY